MTGQEPLVSVVIASVNGMPSLGECLEHIGRQKGGHPYEVLVVDRCGEALRQDLKCRFPQLLAFMASYAWGETMGAPTGPGDSLARVE